VLSSSLRLLNQAKEIPLTFMKAFLDSLNWILWELFILYNKIVEIISQIIGTSWSSVSIKHSEKADLRPFNFNVCFVFWLQNV
jgi:hypothetical protein